MARYKIRITFTPKGNQTERGINAPNFDKACERATKQFRTWLTQGHHVEIYNPGEE